jgi:hypothetical protein
MGWTLEEVKGAKTLIEGLIHLDPAQQLTGKEVLAHPWLKYDPTLH